MENSALPSRPISPPAQASAPSRAADATAIPSTLNSVVSVSAAAPAAQRADHSAASASLRSATEDTRMASVSDKAISPLSSESVTQAANLLLAQQGKMVVTPTKVGYIIMTADSAGLERKFDSKERPKTKPAVVLCNSLEQLSELAQTNAKVDEFYKLHWDQDVLLGCILPWKADAFEQYVQSKGCENLVNDKQRTSCFVIKFGRPSEQVSKQLWDQKRLLAFASSANPSGRGNRGKVAGIGDRIESKADMVIGADEFVASYQPNKSDEDRYHQGVMVSMVDDSGQLIDAQTGRPKLIRTGLDADRIQENLDRVFPEWDYTHGQYY